LVLTYSDTCEAIVFNLVCFFSM